MLTLIPTPIGNLQDITDRAVTKLNSCELLLCEDTRVTKQLLTLLSKQYPISCDAKMVSFHQYNHKQRLAEIANQLKDCEVVYVSDAGMPAISDPGAELVQYCQQEGITYDVLPGANAAITAFAASGFEGAFTFYGFLPKTSTQKAFEQVMENSTHTVVYESPHRIQKTVQSIQEYDPQRKLFLAKEISKKFQTFYYGRARDIELKNTKGEWVVVIYKATQGSVTLSQQELLQLPLPLKTKSKLLARCGTQSAKEWYNTLLNSQVEK